MFQETDLQTQPTTGIRVTTTIISAFFITFAILAFVMGFRAVVFDRIIVLLYQDISVNVSQQLQQPYDFAIVLEAPN
jgi:hypothetical protein